MKHGNERFFIKDEGLVDAPLFPEELFREKNGLHEQVLKPPRMFCRLFSKGDQPNAEGLIELGLSMETERREDTINNLDSEIPAGYTYLGQFIDHDITLDRTEFEIDGDTDLPMQNFRTPSLDLDSLYLDGPEKNPNLYNSDKRTFKFGKTSRLAVDFRKNIILSLQDLLLLLNWKVGKLIKLTSLGLIDFDNDLPRKGNNAGSGEKPTDAVIGDDRNDENLALAQTHLAFLKYHNALAAADPNKSFEELRREVTLHYQAVVLTDFLPRILDKEVFNDVLQNGRKFYTDDKKDCMPIEFSVAAYRLGHSMIRPSYQWNRIHNSNSRRQIAKLSQLFEFSGGSGSGGEGDSPLQGNKTLPSEWIIDWRRFYEVDGEKYKQLNYTRKLDTSMAFSLNNLPQFRKMGVSYPFLSLATRNLLRGRLVSLPSGQQVAYEVNETALTSNEILFNLEEKQARILTKHGFNEVTPLWYYILREAMVQANGNHLGKVGSRIVAETFVGLIKNSPVNVISERPTLSFSMPELLQAIPQDINPLGDQ